MFKCFDELSENLDFDQKTLLGILDKNNLEIFRYNNFFTIHIFSRSEIIFNFSTQKVQHIYSQVVGQY